MLGVPLFFQIVAISYLGNKMKECHIEEMERKEAELDPRYKAEDVAEITGRCAACKEKCKWFQETIKELDLSLV